MVDPGAVAEAVATALGVTTPVGNSMPRAWRRRCRDDGCWWCWITASMCWTRAPSWWKRSWPYIDRARPGDEPGRIAGGGGTVVAGAGPRCPSRDGVGSRGVVRRTCPGREPGVRSSRRGHDGRGGGNLLEAGWHRLGDRVGGSPDGCHESAGSARPARRTDSGCCRVLGGDSNVTKPCAWR